MSKHVKEVSSVNMGDLVVIKTKENSIVKGIVIKPYPHRKLNDGKFCEMFVYVINWESIPQQIMERRAKTWKTYGIDLKVGMYVHDDDQVLYCHPCQTTHYTVSGNWHRESVTWKGGSPVIAPKSYKWINGSHTTIYAGTYYLPYAIVVRTTINKAGNFTRTAYGIFVGGKEDTIHNVVKHAYKSAEVKMILST